jgi:hypothetical protein
MESNGMASLSPVEHQAQGEFDDQHPFVVVTE